VLLAPVLLAPVLLSPVLLAAGVSLPVYQSPVSERCDAVRAGHLSGTTHRNYLR